MKPVNLSVVLFLALIFLNEHLKDNSLPPWEETKCPTSVSLERQYIDIYMHFGQKNLIPRDIPFSYNAIILDFQFSISRLFMKNRAMINQIHVISRFH